MKVSEEPVCIDLFRQNLVFTSLHLKSPVHVVPRLFLQKILEVFSKMYFVFTTLHKGWGGGEGGL